MKLEYETMMIGCDPEFFFSKKGKIIGSEKIIPEKGLQTNSGYSKIIIDGVQAELNPRASKCRELLANEIRECFREIDITLTKNKGIKANFKQTIIVQAKEMKSLKPESQILGCSPSKNIHKTKNKIELSIAAKNLTRSAGGHIHIGKTDNNTQNEKRINEAIKNPKSLVPMLDIIVGNTCVLIDRDPGNIERRKVYGKAGEYRTPSHGLEYRTLSNFWLENYKLMSFVTGLARFAVVIIANSNNHNKLEQRIKKSVRMKDIENAINNNDFNLAHKNFKRIEKIIAAIVPKEDNPEYAHFPLNKDNLKAFEYFVQKGKEHWIKEDPIKHWKNLGTSSENPRIGWEKFLETEVKTEMKKELALTN